jgi:hypothetical protein
MEIISAILLKIALAPPENSMLHPAHKLQLYRLLFLLQGNPFIFYFYFFGT